MLGVRGGVMIPMPESDTGYGIEYEGGNVYFIKDRKGMLRDANGKEIEVISGEILSHHPMTTGITIPARLDHLGCSEIREQRTVPLYQQIQRRAEELIEDAKRAGVILTIELEPQLPLAMGNYQMVARTRSRSYRNG